MGLFHECCGLNPGAPANQSRLRSELLVVAQTAPFRAILGVLYRSPFTDIGSCLQGLFSTHGFCTCGEAGSACNDRLVAVATATPPVFGSSCRTRRDRGRSDCQAAGAALSTVCGQQ